MFFYKDDVNSIVKRFVNEFNEFNRQPILKKNFLKNRSKDDKGDFENLLDLPMLMLPPEDDLQDKKFEMAFEK